MNYDDWFSQIWSCWCFFPIQFGQSLFQLWGKRGTFISHLTSYKALNFKSNTLHDVFETYEVNKKAKKEKKRNINYWKQCIFEYKNPIERFLKDKIGHIINFSFYLKILENKTWQRFQRGIDPQKKIIIIWQIQKKFKIIL